MIDRKLFSYLENSFFILLIYNNVKKLIIRIIKKTDVFVKFYEYTNINILLNFSFKVNFNKKRIKQ